MQVPLSKTTRPPEPIMAPTSRKDSKSIGVSANRAGTHPPEGPPICTAFNRRPAGVPPPMSSTTSRIVVPMGSSLKLCVIAEGKADVYPRLGPTSEWDTAAAHAVVLGAGGQVVDCQGKPLQYNAEENILNPWFLVYGDQGRDWTGYVAP